MGGLFGGKTTTKSNQTVDTGPSKFQQPYLDSAFNAAQSNYNSSKDTPYYQGETYAGLSADQQATLDKIKGYASGPGMSVANSISSLGQGLINDTSGKAVDNLNKFTDLAGTDATAANTKAAGVYANNPYLDAQIDANSRDVTRNLAEVQLPGIDRAASGGGNINSSRAGVASGIAQRGAADRVADISATMRGDAYNRGLTLAQQDRGQQLNALSTAAGQYANLTNQGINAVNTGTQLGYDALGQEAQAGAIEQQNRQGQDDADFKKWQGEDSRKSDLLNRYMQIIGSNNWGQYGTTTGKTTQTQSGNIFGQLVGAGALAGSFISPKK